MKATLFALLLISSCYSWRQQRHVQGWQYVEPAYTANCFEVGGQIVLEGLYQGQNVYVMNPIEYCTDSSTKFCAYEVVINDSIHIPQDSLGSSAFEIPMTSYGFREGDSIRIVIKHLAGCSPKVLNPEVR